MTKKLSFLLLGCATLALSACNGADDIASPGEGTLVVPPTTGGGGTTPPPGGGGTGTGPATSCPTGTVSRGNITNATSNHSGGANFVLGAGSVRFFPYSAATTLVDMSTRAGGEVVNASEL